MNTVVTISLNGRAYKLEQEAYDALKEYLDDAGGRLTNNPDQGEIIEDLERSVAEKCDAALRQHQDVVTAAEVAQMLDEIGTVDADMAGEAAATPVEQGSPAHVAEADAPVMSSGAGAPGALLQPSKRPTRNVALIVVAVAALGFLAVSVPVFGLLLRSSSGTASPAATKPPEVECDGSACAASLVPPGDEAVAGSMSGGSTTPAPEASPCAAAAGCVVAPESAVSSPADSAPTHTTRPSSAPAPPRPAAGTK